MIITEFVFPDEYGVIGLDRCCILNLNDLQRLQQILAAAAAAAVIQNY